LIYKDYNYTDKILDNFDNIKLSNIYYTIFFHNQLKYNIIPNVFKLKNKLDKEYKSNLGVSNNNNYFFMKFNKEIYYSYYNKSVNSYNKYKMLYLII
jgi:hypothetical protein